MNRIISIILLYSYNVMHTYFAIREGYYYGDMAIWVTL